MAKVYEEKEEHKVIQLKNGKVRKTIDWDSFTIPSDRGKHVDEYLEEMRGNDRKEFERRKKRGFFTNRADTKKEEENRC